MNRITVTFLSFCLTLPGPVPTAGQPRTMEAEGAAPPSLVFPQVADGGGYRTTLLLTNRSGFAATATVSFFSDSGAPLVLAVGEKTGDTFTLPLPALGAAALACSGKGSAAATGWAAVTVNPPADLNGNAIFQLYQGGALLSEASVPASTLTSGADFYAAEEDGFSTGFAMANPGSLPLSGTITLRKSDGSIAGSAPLALVPGGHLSMFLSQLFPGAASGRAEIQLSSGYAAFTALRYHTSSVFSTVSVGQSSVSALFSPGGGVQNRIVAEIDKARASIDIAIYSFTADPIREALIRAKSRGLAIRIIADSSQTTSTGSEIALLEQLGFQLKRTSGVSNGIMHNKYMILDGVSLFTGSYNWSASAESYNYENAVFLQGLPVIRDFQANFDRLWSR